MTRLDRPKLSIAAIIALFGLVVFGSLGNSCDDDGSKPKRIEDPGVVSKSYPGYWSELEKAGFGIAPA